MVGLLLRGRRHHDDVERGQLLPLLALVILVAGGACLLVGRLAGHAVDAARARTAADAAALAAVTGSDADATELARRNGATVVTLERRGEVVAVEVDAGGERVRSRASAAGPVAPSSANGMAPVLRAALARAGQLLGRAVAAHPVPGDPLAADVPVDADALATVASRVGLHRADGSSVRFRVGVG